jgi:putative membrane protein
MRNVKWMSAGICVGLLFSAGLSFADGAAQRTTPASAAAPADRDFLVRALGVNQTEIVLGRMAIARGTTPDLRAIGEKMVQRHTELARQLGEIAQISPASEPPTFTADQQRTIARLAAVSEYEFDRSFKTTVDAGHVDELAMYREEVSHAADPRLRALASGRVTALEQSLAKASQESSVPPQKRGW